MFKSGSELGFFIPYLDVTELVHFPARTASTLILSIFGYIMGHFRVAVCLGFEVSVGAQPFSVFT